MIILKQNTYSTPVTNIQNTIYINNSKLQLDKVKRKIYYWHLINNIIHTPKAITKWENIYTNFKLKDHNFWKAIFKMTFLCNKHTAIQTFQYKLIHRNLPCNKWLNNIKIKSNNICTYCSSIDSISHFLIDSENKYTGCLLKPDVKLIY